MKTLVTLLAVLSACSCRRVALWWCSWCCCSWCSILILLNMSHSECSDPEQVQSKMQQFVTTLAYHTLSSSKKKASLQMMVRKSWASFSFLRLRQTREIPVNDGYCKIAGYIVDNCLFGSCYCSSC